MTKKNISNKELAFVYPVLAASLETWYSEAVPMKEIAFLFGAGVSY